MPAGAVPDVSMLKAPVSELTVISPSEVKLIPLTLAAGAMFWFSELTLRVAIGFEVAIPSL